MMRTFISCLVIAFVSLPVSTRVLCQETLPEITLEDEANKLFQKDPNPGDEDSGCQTCKFELNTNTISCAPVTDGQGKTKCTITVTAEEVTCEISGSACSVVQFNL